MFTERTKWLPWTLALMLAGGCYFPIREQVDLTVCEMASRPLDPNVLPTADSSTNSRPSEPESPGSPRTLRDRLKIPPELLGADTPPLALPAPDKTDPKARDEAIHRLYPELPTLPTEPKPDPGPEGHPLTLADLQKLAMSNSPLIRQARASVEAARGAALQAGLYPNPTFGYEGDTAATTGGPGYQGAFVEQNIITGGKLKLARAAASIDSMNAQLALRRAQTDLMAQVRSGYFAVLVAEANYRINLALSRFTEEVYHIQVEQVKGAQAAAYEPLQLRVLAMQARGALVQAHNRYTAAWKQLAANLGLSAMPLTELAGSVDMPIPVYHYDTALDHVLRAHTDVLTAQNTVLQARYNLRSAQITPVPDVSLRVMAQRDFTGPPFAMSPSVAIGVPIPVWDRNQGGIIQNQGYLLKATEESHRVRNDLTGRLAEAFERYENNRVLLEYYRKQILPDQVRAYRGVYERHQQEPDKVDFGTVVNAQQILVNIVTTYVSTLGAQWTAVVDLASLLQNNDLFEVDGKPSELLCVGPIPNLDSLLTLPCCHRCSPLLDPALKGANGTWPPADPAPEAPRPEKQPATKP